MTRKHYVMLAESFARTLADLKTLEGMTVYERMIARDAVHSAVADMAKTLRADNPRFDPDRFIAAATGGTIRA